MRNKVIKKTAVIGAIMVALNGMSSLGVSAEWKKNKENNTWSWLENDLITTGWKLIDGSWYYFNKDGNMHIGWLKDNDKWYKLSDSGSMITGWIFENNKWYYAKTSGDLETDKITLNGITYNFFSDGTMIENDTYNDFSDNNVLAINTSIPEKDGVYKNDEVVTSEKSVNEKSIEKIDKETKKNFTPRINQPNLDDNHYYSNDNIFYKVKLAPPFKKSDGSKIKGNCTWYAWGRTWEITGKKPLEAGFTGNACEWWNANKCSKKYKYGSEPKEGAIAVWKSSLPGSGGCGHVAVVEKIENGKIYISESMWHGDCFAYKEIYSTEYLYGYIYLDEPNY